LQVTIASRKGQNPNFDEDIGEPYETLTGQSQNKDIAITKLHLKATLVHRTLSLTRAVIKQRL
jgi:hypothetical protein